MKGKRFAVLGLQGSGKTVLVKHILKGEPAHLIYDPLHEYTGGSFNRYLATHRQHSDEAIAEINLVINRVVMGTGKVRLLVIDEANRYCPSMKPLPAAVLDLNDFNRHYNIAFGIVARRPVQLHTDLIELAHYLFLFTLKGKNDTAYLDSLAPDLGDAVASLPQYHFIILDSARSYSVHSPI